MTRPIIEDSIERFTLALDALQQALDRRKANDDQLAQYEEDVHLFALDRAKLARELDETLAKLHHTGEVTELVSQRLDRALEQIDGMIALELRRA